jgi:hypothetical protein
MQGHWGTNAPASTPVLVCSMWDAVLDWKRLRLARLAGAGGFAAAGCDLSSDFLAEARRRASAAMIDITFQQAHVEARPYPSQSFEIVRSERLLIYSVIVHTGVGVSNSNVSVEIPYFYCSDSDVGGKKK